MSIVLPSQSIWWGISAIGVPAEIFHSTEHILSDCSGTQSSPRLVGSSSSEILLQMSLC